MRLLFIICESSVEGRIITLLERTGAPGYTHFTGAIGNGRHGRREGTAIWPGLNSIFMTCMPQEMVPAILEGIEHLAAERNGRLAAKVFSVPAEEFS